MISIVAPVYNVKPYLSQFIDSVLSQTYKDFELILVDDCGTDGSGELCQEYAKMDRRIRVIKQPQNGGVSKARNRGLSEVKGDYIMLADSDDYLDSRALEITYHLLISTNTDIAYGGFYTDCDSVIKKKKFRLYKRKYSLDSAIKSHLNLHTLYGYPWGKLFRREVLSDVYDPEDMSCGDDGVFSYRALCNAKRGVSFTEEPIYYYRIRTDSLSGHGDQFAERDLDVMKQVKYVTECTPQQYQKELQVFKFLLYSGAIDKYKKSDLETRIKYMKEYQMMKKDCDSIWRKVLLDALNPKSKLKALKYRTWARKRAK